MAPPVQLLAYDFRAPEGVQFAPLSTAEFLAAFAPRANDERFYVDVIGSSVPLPVARLARGYQDDHEWAAWRLAAGPAHLVGTRLFVSLYNTCALITVEPPEGRHLLAAIELAFVPLCEAIFRLRPQEFWVRAAFAAPMANALDDTLLGLGFELIMSPYDAHGRVTYALRRDVFAELHAEPADEKT